MRAVLFVTLIASLVLQSLGAAETCLAEKCKIEDNCWCSSVTSPLTDGEAPQLISLSFDESVVNSSFTNYWQPLLANRKNPDGNSITATFFVPHEYTDYEIVKNLYVDGFEIGVNSISKTSLLTYWRNATLDTLVKEFGGQRTIISHFANIPVEDIVGARTPLFEIEGDVSIQAYQQAELTYDNSWPTYSKTKLFPYTLDYSSSQQCTVSNQCPVEAHPGFWILPIINIQGTDNTDCNALQNCGVEGTAEEIAAWLSGEVEKVRAANKAPLTMLLNSAWFQYTDNSYDGLKLFLDGLADLEDVFLVSQGEILNWMQAPVTLGNFKTATYDRQVACKPVNCELVNESGETRYMKSCVDCPEVYPWVGNPYGQSNPPTDQPTSTTSSKPDTTTTDTTTEEADTTTEESTTPGTTTEG